MGRQDWRSIHDAIAARIDSGDWPPGARTPTEAELARCFNAGRHSVRRAVQALAVEGRLRVVQGSGAFVQNAPLITYAIGRRTRFRQNLIEQGLTPAGEHIAAETLPAPERIRAALGLAAGALTHRVVRRGLADGAPISLGVTFHPAALFPGLPEQRAAGVSVSEVYRHAGVPDYFRKHTTLYTRRPSAEEARLLRQHPDAPVMVVTKTDVTPAGVAIGHAESVWAGDRVQFTLDTLDEAGGDA